MICRAVPVTFCLTPQMIVEMDSRLDFALKVLMHQLGIAIRAFDPPLFFRDLQPNTRMTQRTFAAVTGHTPFLNNAGLWYRCGHEYSHLVAAGRAPP